MLRRDIRLRREYLLRKSHEGKQKEEYEKKMKIREALAAGKKVPTELRYEAEQLKHTADMEDDQTKQLRTHVDDEYATAGIEDPKVCVTTSRDPSSRLKKFIKEIKLIIPNSQRINRGASKLDELVKACRANNYTDLVIVNEHRGEPTTLIVCHLPYGPTAFFNITNTVMRHDIENVGTMSEAYPHLIFSNMTSKLGERLTNVLKHLFPVPRPDSKRIMTFANQGDFISFRHHTYTKEDHKTVALSEVGPRFELRPYQLRLGTVDQEEAENEWVLHQYTNSSKKRKLLSDDWIVCS
ncbi:u3 small nucleolar ribonucleoprotein [Blastocystis sp. subtype 4]|uniref:u3 small nucleolar ribonucleoprotein n=1 Tax=Blastocystis sp. subtype 4 TaxID=944170 RepID=UPI0007118C96|nr:u3 small nucleolar ribonucleoprotein [Blastocystis sp. subtype 4]KNB46228.1 u3 small nucleolar ribonucleoprotein [Blastocystis sp. subtype 4]|eukprot:XP_014529671.1 u3 small nucleolar ribonucleoprotein [Blastocystis sp. subtype 4]